MLADRPHIVIARPPDPEAQGKAGGEAAAVIVGRKVAPATPPGPDRADHAPAEAAERLWRELVRRVEEERQR